MPEEMDMPRRIELCDTIIIRVSHTLKQRQRGSRPPVMMGATYDLWPMTSLTIPAMVSGLTRAVLMTRW